MSNKKIVFQTPWFHIESEQIDHVSYRTGPFYRLHLPHSVMVVALSSTGELILVNQFRPALNTDALEFPAGRIDAGETPDEAAVREFEEETGYSCPPLVSAGKGRLLQDRADTTVHLYYGEGALRQSSPEAGVEVKLLKPREYMDRVVEGQFAELPSLGVLLYIHWKLHPDALRTAFTK